MAYLEPGLVERYERFVEHFVHRHGGAVSPFNDVSGASIHAVRGLFREDAGRDGASLAHVFTEAHRNAPEAFSSRVVLTLEESSHAGRVRQQLQELGLLADEALYRFSDSLLELGMLALRLPPVPEILPVLTQVSGVEGVYDGDRMMKMDTPDCSDVGYEKGPVGALLQSMDVDAEALGRFWERSVPTNCAAILVAVLDSGIDGEHPLLKGPGGTQVLSRRDFTGENTDLLDPSGHGTHVAGILAGIGGQNDALCGVAPTVKLLDGRVMRARGHGSVFNILSGIVWAIRSRAHVINMSFGGAAAGEPGRSPFWRAMEAVCANGIVPVCAAGNTAGRRTIQMPADYGGAVTVAACDATLARASFSSQGPAWDENCSGKKPNIAAPGVKIVSARPRHCNLPSFDDDEHLASLDGTSMAAPFISGLIALGIGFAPKLKADRVVECLYRSARNPRGHSHYDLGHGVPSVRTFISLLEKEVKKLSGNELVSNYEPVDGEMGGGDSAGVTVDWRSREETLMATIRARVDEVLPLKGDEILGRSCTRIEWHTTEERQYSRILDLSASRGLPREETERLPRGMHASATVYGKKAAFGLEKALASIDLCFLADLAKLVEGNNGSLSEAVLREEIQGILNRRHFNRKVDKSYCVLCGLIPRINWDYKQVCMISIPWDTENEKWVFSDQTQPCLSPCFFPASSADVADQLSRWLEDNGNRSVDVITVSREIGLPEALIVATVEKIPGWGARKYKNEFFLVTEESRVHAK